MKSKLHNFIFLKVTLCLALLLAVSCENYSGSGSSASVQDSINVFKLSKEYKLALRSDIKKAYIAINRLEHYIDSSGYKKALPGFYMNKAKYYLSRGDNDSSEYFNKKAVEWAKKFGDLKAEANAYGNLGNSAYNRGDLVTTLDYFLKSEKLLEAINDKWDIATTTGNIGVLYCDMKDYKGAMSQHEKAIALRTELKDTMGLALSYGNVANVYYALGKKEEALSWVRKSYQTYKSARSKPGMGFTLGNLASLYKETNHPDSAIYFCENSLKVRTEMEDIPGIADANSVMSDILFSQGKTDEALLYLNKAKDVYEQTSNLAELSKTEQRFSTIYTQKKQHKQALESYLKHIRYRDSLLNTDKVNELNKKYMTFEFEKKEALNKKELEKQKLFRNGIFYGAGLLLLLVFLMYRNFRNKKKANQELAQQKHIIEEKQKEILDSIEYARQIQRALIANHEMANKIIPDSFVMFKPKDIVSGDFYWATQTEGSAEKEEVSLHTAPSHCFYLAVCDSTGHGVPGAFMSLLNISFMNEAIIEKNISDPAAVFEYVRKKLIENISQNGRQDGMDGILICLDVKNNIIWYCAANNSPLLITDGSVLSLPADKMPVGKGEKTNAFTTHTIHIKKGDMLYLYTDGYADQFGGEKGKKFKYKPLENLLLSVHKLPVQEQKDILEKTFEEWKGSLEQVDDVCVLGIRF